ncbi:hypothetical protein NIES267_60200 [Calothrix parasitica NIES-267]|uniref:Cyanovirin-N domain-containing protein n=1 Tax=Calothrix parasitica NIES-267 TaxID=1973488 RepID=A0A1Z4LZA7_9CYAN|nr:hypothetical protein NIES267_60200 [Calothrix parasitica NIES-267]
MQFLNHKLIGVASFFTFSVINVIFSQSAVSAVSCEAGTINRYSNGSLKYCILARDTKVRIGNNQSGTSIFPCKVGNYINFTEKSQFQRCKLSEEIKIKTGNSVTICPTDYNVSVSTLDDGKMSVECSNY